MFAGANFIIEERLKQQQNPTPNVLSVTDDLTVEEVKVCIKPAQAKLSRAGK